MIKELLKETDAAMDKTLEVLRSDLMAIRTGRASPSLVERLSVEYYGMFVPLSQLAAISAPEPRLLVIRPYNQGDIGAIERSIHKSDLGLSPNNDGKLIRLNIPRLTEERRRDLVRVVRRRVEEGRVGVRNIRRRAIDDLRDFEKEKLISEDDLYAGKDEIQELADRFVAEIDRVGRRKEEEVMEI
jgi:ribosome recycling factor